MQWRKPTFNMFLSARTVNYFVFSLMTIIHYLVSTVFHCSSLTSGSVCLPLPPQLYPRIILIRNLRIIALILNFSPKHDLWYYITPNLFGYHQCCFFSYFMTPAWNMTMEIDTMLKKRENNYILGFFWTWVTKLTFE